MYLLTFITKSRIMKKILLPVAALVFALGACTTTPKYTISGSVEGEQEGNVYLLKPTESKSFDTLASAKLVAGKFNMEGTANEVIDALLVVEGKKGGTRVFLENVNYTATLNPADNAVSVIEGGVLQNVSNQFLAINREGQKQMSELNKIYSQAYQDKNEVKMNEIDSIFTEVEKTIEAKQTEVIAANPDSYVSAYTITTNMNRLGFEELTVKFNSLGEAAKATVPGQKIADRLARLAVVAIGQIAPDFTMATPAGDSLSLHSIKGKVKIIDFWASWCGPCRRMNPEVVELYKEFHPKGLEIIGVSLDREKDAWVKAIADDKLAWNHVSDLGFWKNAAAQLYVINSIPSLVLLDENNTIVAKNLHGEELKQKVAEMLK